MEKMTAKRLEKERIKLKEMIDQGMSFKMESYRRQVFVLLSCCEHYLSENINYSIYNKTYEKVYKIWSIFLEHANRNIIYAVPNKKIKVDSVIEEWNKFKSIAKNTNDYLSPEALEQKWKLKAFIAKYYQDSNLIKELLGLDKTVEDITRDINNPYSEKRNDIHDANKANRITYYKIYFQNHPYTVETMKWIGDFDYTCTETKQFIDNAIDFTGNTKDKYIVSAFVYAKKDETGTREIMTGKPLKKWPDVNKVISMPSENYIYYETIEEVPESEVANNLAQFLDSNIDGLTDEYISRLNAKQHDFIERTYRWRVENNLEEIRRRKYEEEASKRSPNSVNKLRAYKPKTPKNK